MLDPNLNSLTPTPLLPLNKAIAIPRLKLPPEIHDFLIGLGAVYVEISPHVMTPFCFLELGHVDNIYFWLEFFEIDSLGMNWFFRSQIVEIPEDTHSFKPLCQIVHRFESGKSYRDVNQDRTGLRSGERLANLQELIQDCLAKINLDQIIFDLSVRANTRIESRLTGLGYAVAWPPEVVFDLERITVKDANRCDRNYYVDDPNSIVFDGNGGIHFQDLRGERISISAGSSFTIDSMTFANIAELAAENTGLVVSQVELFEGFFYADLIGAGEHVAICGLDAGIDDPLVTSGWLAHEFSVPIPAIAEMLKPIVETGGLPI